MEIKHEIMEFNPVTGSILVKYFSDEFTEGFAYNIDVPIVDGQLASQEVIDELIEAFKPVGQIERMAQMKVVSIPQFLLEKVPEPVVITEPSPDQPTIFGVDGLPTGA